MIRLRIFSTLLFFLIVSGSFAQHRIFGVVSSQHDSTLIKESTIYLNKNRNTFSDSNGKFEFTNVTNGSYLITIISPDHKTIQQKVIVNGKDLQVNIYLPINHKELEEVTIKEKQSEFGFTYMKGVENMGIYEGKKSEVIIPDQMVANQSTNNARQIYARVAGLNIVENDGSGLQLSIGGRGLDPNRSSNFNVRQNGYDISADALGYPESYYTPPVEGLDRIQIVRGAASLQYGTQFGGMINFVMKKPVDDRKIQVLARQTMGSFGFYNSFTSLSGTVGKLSYYTFFQYKKGNGWRPNSNFDNYTYYGNVNYKLSNNTRIGIDLTQMGYLAHQPGGLSDNFFYKNPRQSNRERNWFKVNWTLMALHLDHKFNARNEINLRVFGLSAYRYSLGFRPNRVENKDDNSMRDLIKGEFTNWGAEARYLKRYSFMGINSVLLAGSRFYHGFNHSIQGSGTTGRDADFTFVNPDQFIISDYSFPNRNVSLFAENIIYINDKLSITPGIRFEYISTTAKGNYKTIIRDNAGNNIIVVKDATKNRLSNRQFAIAGLGISYKPTSHLNIYGNISQNYRSITFADMQIVNPSSVIDPNLKDESGYSADLGVRNEQTSAINFDFSFFYLNYDNRIGEILTVIGTRDVRLRRNTGQSAMMGLELYVESDLIKLIKPKEKNFSGVAFINLALINSIYKNSQITGVQGNRVEFVPQVNLKTGFRLAYKELKASLQYSYISDQFSEATNAVEGGATGLVGIIPAYNILDLSLSYQYKKFKIEGSVNNLANSMYFTRRATGYPGPGILPSDGRAFYLTLQVKL